LEKIILMKIELSEIDFARLVDRLFGVGWKYGRKMTVTARMRLQNFQTHSKHEYLVEAIEMNEDETKYKLEVRKA